jgi:hypothetical protein
MIEIDLKSESPQEAPDSAGDVQEARVGLGWGILLDVSYRNKSTMVICIAGFCTNFVTGEPHALFFHFTPHRGLLHQRGRGQGQGVLGVLMLGLSGLALGLLASWARDGLLMSSDQRNFYSSCYSFLKGLSQFLTGYISDRIGRKGPIAGGLVRLVCSLRPCIVLHTLEHPLAVGVIWTRVCSLRPCIALHTLEHPLAVGVIWT